MFGFVTANLSELDPQQRNRYQAVYCGICRQIRESAGQPARLCLSYDMTFLALLLMSLYEPEERGGGNACILHPILQRLQIAKVRFGVKVTHDNYMWILSDLHHRIYRLFQCLSRHQPKRGTHSFATATTWEMTHENICRI